MKGIWRDSLLLLTATGTVIDPESGVRKTTTLQFYNVAIPVKDDSDAETERCLCNREVTSNCDGKTIRPFVKLPRYRQAEMLRLNIKHAAEGEVIEPATMEVLIKAAQRLSELPLLD